MNEHKSMIKVLLIEDNEDEAKLMKYALNGVIDCCFEFTHVVRLSEALKQMESEKFDVVLLDLSLPDSQGIGTFSKMQPYTSIVPVVVLTGLDDEFLALKAVSDGAQDYLVKQQVNIGLLSRVIRHAIERHRLIEKINSLSLRDDLTELHNRRGFFLFADQHLKLTERKKDELFLIFFDLDGLKSINDTFGHYEGDNALKAAAQALKKSFRDSDIVARIGGDEFAVLTIQSPQTTAETIAVRIEDKFKEQNVHHPRPYRLSVSFGILKFSSVPSASIDKLLSQADALMYEQKQKKRKK